MINLCRAMVRYKRCRAHCLHSQPILALRFSMGPMRIVYAGIALAAIFLPAFLLLIGALPYWESLKQNRAAQAALKGVNAGIVGILLAALYDPIFVDTVKTSIQFVFVIVLFIFLQLWKRPPWQAVLLAAIAGLLFL